MKKILLIGWKDVTVAFRDRAALILMLLAPFALTLGLGFVTGRLSSSGNNGLSNIPVVLVNQDGGQLGNELVSLFQSKDLSTLVASTVMDDPALAFQQVDSDQAVAAIIIPAGFTNSIIPKQNSGSTTANDVVQIKFYTNPTNPTRASVIKTILDEFISRVEIGRVGGQVTVAQMVNHGLIKVQDAAQVGSQIGMQQAISASGSTSITLKNVASGSEAVNFDVLAYMAPGMALMFLMYTVTNGGRTLLAERAQGTLPRLLVSPTSTYQVLGGKVCGIFLTGTAQMLILILTSSLLFQLNWGDPLAVLVLVLAAVVGAVGWGMLITAFARTPGQVGWIGSAVMLTFGVLGGSFFSRGSIPEWVRFVGKITPNAWGVDGFTTLAMGGRLMDIREPIIALLVMGAILFIISVFIISRRGMAQQ